MEKRLEPRCEICADLLTWHDADQEELFFEVFMEEEARENLNRTSLRKLLDKWSVNEFALFKQLT